MKKKITTLVSNFKKLLNLCEILKKKNYYTYVKFTKKLFNENISLMKKCTKVQYSLKKSIQRHHILQYTHTLILIFSFLTNWLQMSHLHFLFPSGSSLIREKTCLSMPTLSPVFVLLPVSIDFALINTLVD